MSRQGLLRYRLLDVLGAGAAGDVRRVEDRETGEAFALKVLRNASSAWLPGFKEEYRSLAHLRHPGLVAYHALWEEEGQWMLLMDLVEGHDLALWVEARRRGLDRPRTSGEPTGTTAEAEMAPSPYGRDRSLESGPTDETMDLGAAGLAPPDGAPGPSTGEAAPPRPDEDTESATFEFGSADLAPVEPEPRPPLPDPWCDLDRLRALLPGMLDALDALHQAGLVHRDLKPANVRVRADGAPVLLDFGLAAPVEGTPRAVAGTPRYMAPESLTGLLGPATDLYSLGALLFDLVAGGPAHAGSGAELLHRKRMEPAPPIGDQVAGVPAPLAEIIDALLRIDPDQRPDSASIRRHLGLPPGASAPRTLPVVGRDAERQALDAALAAARGGPRVAVVRGASGMGKSTLLQAWTRAVQRSGAAALAGTCHAMEQLPYKALDAVVDDLRRRVTVARLRGAELDRAAAVLGTVFATFGGSALAPPAGPTALGGALADAMRALGRGRPTLVVIDDAQWGDGDSARVLDEMMRLAPDLPVLVCLAVRTDTPPGPFVTALAAARPPDLDLQLQALGEADLRVALGRLGLPTERLGALVAAAQSSTYLVAELLRGHDGENDLQALIAGRLAALTPEARQVAELVSLGVGPMEVDLVEAACGILAPGLPVVRALGEARAARLLHLGPSPEGMRVGPYHSQVRAALARALHDGRAQTLHHGIAQAWTAHRPDAHAQVAHHWAAAGEAAAARAAYVRACDQAAQAGAWGLLASLLDRVLALSSPADADVPSLRLRRAEALARGGQRAAAGRALLDLAPELPADEARQHRILAGEHLLRSGQLDEGLSVLRALAAEAGLPWSSNRWVTIGRIVVERIRLSVRGYTPKPRDPAREDPATLQRIDLLAALNRSLRLNAPFDGLVFGSRFVREALDLGEPNRLCAALALECGTLMVKGTARPPVADEVAAQVQALAEDLGDTRTLMSTWYNLAVAAYLRGDFAAAARWQARGDEASEQLGEEADAEADLRESSPGTIAWYTGQYPALKARADAGLASARERGDRWMSAWLRLGFHAVCRGLCGDPLDRLQREVDAVEQEWPSDPYTVQHLSALIAMAELSLMAGDPARGQAQYEAHLPSVRREMLDQAQFSRGLFLDQRARLAAALGDHAAALALLDQLDQEGAPWLSVSAGLTRGVLASDRALLSDVAERATALGLHGHADVAAELLDGEPRRRPGIDRRRRFSTLAPGRSDPCR